jgi:hypothetical protein
MGCGHEASTLSGGGLLLTTAKLITTGVRFPRVGEYDMPRWLFQVSVFRVVRLSPKKP